MRASRQQPAVDLRAGLPRQAGLGLRAPHYREVIESAPPVAWWEVHSENFFAEGGAAPAFLDAVRARWPVSLHGVGASLGGVDTLFDRHLERLARLVERVEPAAVSEHLCWSSSGGAHFNDLLPLPYTREAIDFVAERVDRMQERLKRAILIENVSSYLQWRDAEYSEWDFVAELARRTGCGILLDVNNIYVSACNHGFDPLAFLEAMPPAQVGEIHLAGYEVAGEGDAPFLVDTHGARVHAPVWDLYERALERFGPVPTLIEWDTVIPALDVLLGEVAEADRRLQACVFRPEAEHAFAG
jgi:uncharacterized protein (UPF0276 family)